jgi:hypothetical protein
MDYDLWVRLAKTGPLLYTPHRWANFRLHSTGKSLVDDDRCYPEMLRVYRRELGDRPSWLEFRWRIRKLTYAWLPIKLRVQIRRILTR